MPKTKKDPTPYLAIDTITGADVARYATLFDGNYANKGKPVEVYYRPRKRGF
jgi:hypothetical protein